MGGEPLKPGMRLVDVGVTGRAAKAVKPTAFLAADNLTLVVHVVNAQDKDAPIALKLAGKFATATAAGRTRTSASEDAAIVAALSGSSGSFIDTLPAKSMATYRFEITGK
jgi:Glycosyl hydrolase family 30 beta sandwich domain